MNILRLKQFLVVFLSFLAAWIMMVLPVFGSWQWIRPEWLTLVLIYWIFALPHSVGIFIGWCAGLVMDVLNGEGLGQYALSMVVVAFFAHFLRYRIRLLPLWQQILSIFMLVATHKFILFLVQWLNGNPPRTLLYWVSMLSSVILWPLISALMKRYQQKVLG